jgi:hypothetical protein
MAEPNDAGRRAAGISRRELLRRGAVVGGTLVWATPVIQSLATPAGAQAQYQHRCCFCSNPNGTFTCIFNGSVLVPSSAQECAETCRAAGFSQSQYDEGNLGTCTCNQVTGCVCP